MKVRSYT